MLTKKKVEHNEQHKENESTTNYMLTENKPEEVKIEVKDEDSKNQQQEVVPEAIPADAVKEPLLKEKAFINEKDEGKSEYNEKPGDYKILEDEAEDQERPEEKDTVDEKSEGKETNNEKPALPPGWRVSSREGVVGPSGEVFRSRRAALHWLLSQGGSREQVEGMREALGEEGWRGHPLLPEGWRVKMVTNGKKGNKKKNRKMFLVKNGDYCSSGQALARLKKKQHVGQQEIENFQKLISIDIEAETEYSENICKVEEKVEVVQNVEEKLDGNVEESEVTVSDYTLKKINAELEELEQELMADTDEQKEETVSNKVDTTETSVNKNEEIEEEEVTANVLKDEQIVYGSRMDKSLKSTNAPHETEERKGVSEDCESDIRLEVEVNEEAEIEIKEEPENYVKEEQEIEEVQTETKDDSESETKEECETEIKEECETEVKEEAESEPAADEDSVDMAAMMEPQQAMEVGEGEVRLPSYSTSYIEAITRIHVRDTMASRPAHSRRPVDSKRPVLATRPMKPSNRAKPASQPRPVPA